MSVYVAQNAVRVALLMFFVLLQPGCWAFGFSAGRPEAFKAERLEPLLGKDRGEVHEVLVHALALGDVLEDLAVAPCEIVKARGLGCGAAMFGYLPVPVCFRESALYCVLLEYTSNDRLANYTVKSTGLGVVVMGAGADAAEPSCLELMALYVEGCPDVTLITGDDRQTE